jgi:hypothetical protein
LQHVPFRGTPIDDRDSRRDRDQQYRDVPQRCEDIECFRGKFVIAPARIRAITNQMRDGPPVSDREISNQNGSRHIGERRCEPGEVQTKQARDIGVAHCVAERPTCADREERPACLREQLLYRDTPVRRAEHREHDHANRREDRARHNRIGNHEPQRAAERIGHG